MPLQIIRQDITRFPCDAVVNAAKKSLLGGGGVDGAIHRAAGPELLNECRTLGGCPTGEARITKGYRLPCKYVIHTVGPVWRGGSHGEQALLESCYRSSLALAAEYNCETVAFPLISSGIFGYPKDQALRAAVDTIADFLADHDMTVYILIYDRAGFRIGKKLYAGVRSYISDHYVEDHTDHAVEKARRAAVEARFASAAPPDASSRTGIFPGFMGLRKSEAAPMAGAAFPLERAAAPESADSEELEEAGFPAAEAASADTLSLDEMLDQIDESFSQMLLRKIDERGMTDAQCYKKANIDRKLFSKIRSNIHYKPSKPTAAAFAIALELPLPEARDLLSKAGFALSHSSKFDIIIEYFLVHGNYNIFEINETLFAFDQSLLGT